MVFEKALKIVLSWEAGYVNDPHDPGGETKYGICKRQYPEIDIANLTIEKAAEIYKRDYWNKCSCDSFEEPVAILLFDTAVNMGVVSAITMLQTITGGIDVDGVIGPKTIHVVNMTDQVKIVREFASARFRRYTQMDGWEYYGKGWTRRLVDVVIKAVSG
jgi:lysozyme family protein